MYRSQTLREEINESLASKFSQLEGQIFEKCMKEVNSKLHSFEPKRLNSHEQAEIGKQFEHKLRDFE